MKSMLPSLRYTAVSTAASLFSLSSALAAPNASAAQGTTPTAPNHAAAALDLRLQTVLASVSSGLAPAGASTLAYRTALPTIGADGRLAVIVTFRRSGPLAEPEFDVLRSLGLVRGVHLQALPMVLVQATPAQVRSLARHPKVASVWSNQPVRLFNRQARELSGAALVSERPGDFQRAIPVVGRGVTILLNDSGVDTANPDIPLGQRVVDNVQGTLNFGATSVNDAAGSRFVPVVHVRNQINTDIGEGHGTHISGTLVGSGLGSAGRYKGVATGADLVSYGSGVVLPLFDTLGGLDFALANQFAYRHPIRVTSNSWGSSDKTFSCLDPSNIATYELYKKGIISVFAAGNDGSGEGTQNPNSRTPWVISVGAGEKDGVLKASLRAVSPPSRLSASCPTA